MPICNHPNPQLHPIQAYVSNEGLCVVTLPDGSKKAVCDLCPLPPEWVEQGIAYHETIFNLNDGVPTYHMVKLVDGKIAGEAQLELKHRGQPGAEEVAEAKARCERGERLSDIPGLAQVADA